MSFFVVFAQVAGDNGEGAGADEEREAQIQVPNLLALLGQILTVLY